MSRHGAARRRREQAGFTLLELLIALTLLGLMMLMLTGGLRFGVRVWDQGDRRLEAVARLQIVQQLIRRQLQGALAPVEIPAGGQGDDRPFRHSLSGGPDSLVLSAPAPAQSGLGGIYRIALHPAETPGGRQLVMTWHLSRTGREDPRAEAGASQVVLLDRLDGLAIEYDDDTPGTVWQSRWEPPDTLPASIRLRLTFPAGDPRGWPPLLVALETR